MKDYTNQLEKYWKTNELTFVATFKKTKYDYGYLTHFRHPDSGLKIQYPDIENVKLKNKELTFYTNNIKDLVHGEEYEVHLVYSENSHKKGNPYNLKVLTISSFKEQKIFDTKKESINSNNLDEINPFNEHIVQRYELRTKDPDGNKIIANLLRKIGKGMYSSKQRVIFELLQNADDSPGGKEVDFHINFKDEYFIVMHDGAPFDTDDIDAITSAAESTKRNDKKKIGYKGIGFKSVFTDSTEVWVKSGGYQFAFLKTSKMFKNFEEFYFSSSDYKQVPGLMEKHKEQYKKEIALYNSETDIPWQIIPIWQENLPQDFLDSKFKYFNNPVQFAMKVGVNNIRSNDGYINAVDNILKKSQFILFLRNISKFQSPKNRTTVVKLEYKKQHIKIVKTSFNYVENKMIEKKLEYNYYKEIFDDIKISTQEFEKYKIEMKVKKNDLNDDKYYFTDKEGNIIETIPPKLAALTETEISFGFSIFKDKISAEIDYTKNSTHYSSLFTYLPMEDTRFQLPFLVNADFVTSSNRQIIQGDNLWNRYIMIKVAEKHVEALELFAEKFIHENEKYSNYLSLLLKKLLPDDVTAQQIIKSYNNSYINKLNMTPIIVNDFEEKQFLRETIVDDSGFTDLFSHDLFYKIINTNKRLPHTGLNVNYLKNTIYTDLEIIDLKSLIFKITPEICHLIGKEIANERLFENQELLKWLNKIVNYRPNLFRKIPFLIHQNKLFSLDELLAEQDVWVLNSKTLVYKSFLNSLGYHAIDLKLDTYTAINAYLLTIEEYISNKDLAYERISRNSNLSSLNSIIKVRLIYFFRNSTFMQGIAETKYFWELKLFNDENGTARPIKQLISREEELEIDSIQLYRIDQEEYAVLPGFLKNEFIKKEKIFYEFVLKPELFKDWTTLFDLNTISNYVNDLKIIYSWHPEHIKIHQSKWVAIPWIYENNEEKFIESNHVFWSNVFSKMQNETYEMLKYCLENVNLKVLPNKQCGELISLFELKTDSRVIEGWQKIKQIDTDTANTLLDWMVDDGNYSDFFENYTLVFRNEFWDIIELESEGVFAESESELSEYIDNVESLKNRFNKLSSDLCHNKRNKIGLLHGDKLLKAIIETKLFDQNLAKFIPAKSEWKLIEDLITNLSVFNLHTDVEYKINSPEHILINHISKYVEDPENIPEVIQSLINQFRSKITINEQPISNFDLSDLIRFSKGEDGKELKISQVLNEFRLIMNFPDYKYVGEIEYGIDGPEINDDKLYISIYHYLEFLRENPIDYNILKLGEYLTSKSFDFKVCKYKCQNFDTNKFNLELLKEERSNFNKYKKTKNSINSPTSSYRQSSYSVNYKPCPQCGAMHNASFNRCAVCNDFSAANDYNDWY